MFLLLSDLSLQTWSGRLEEPSIRRVLERRSSPLLTMRLVTRMIALRMEMRREDVDSLAAKNWSGLIEVT